MKFSTAVVASALSFGSALATVPEWGQCGGINYTGDTSKSSVITLNVSIRLQNLGTSLPF